MTRTLLTLVSEQTLPNVLFIKQFGPFDEYWFLTTTKMEEDGRADAIIDTCQIKKARKWKVDAEKIWEVLGKLQQLNLPEGGKLVINLTGGTKMMALGVYAYFTNAHPELEVYYMPVKQPVVFRIFPANEASWPPPCWIDSSTGVKLFSCKAKATGWQTGKPFLKEKQNQKADLSEITIFITPKSVQ